MPIYKIKEGTVEKVKPTRFVGQSREKQLQRLIERNLDRIFDMTFVATEHPTSHGGRIDTLAFDAEKRPVIIEYKEDKSSTILLQGLYYMDWLIENKAEFEKLVRGRLKQDVKVNWRGGVRLLLIAKEFEIWDKFAVNRVSEDVDLFSYDLYENDEIKIERVPLPKDFKSKIKMRITSAKEITIEQLFSKIKNEKMREMAIELRDAIKGMSDGIEERTSLYSVRFRTSLNFAAIYAQKRGFWLDVKIPRKEFKIKKLDVRPHKDPVWTHIRVDEGTDLSLLVKAAEQAYERTL